MRVPHKKNTLKSSDGVAFPSKPSASGHPGVPYLFLGRPLLAAPSRPRPVSPRHLPLWLCSPLALGNYFMPTCADVAIPSPPEGAPCCQGPRLPCSLLPSQRLAKGGPTLLVERTRPRRSGVDDRMSHGRGGWGPVRAEGARPLDMCTGQTWSRTKARGLREAWERLCLRVVTV